MKHYYDILGVSETASEQEIRKAYKRLALQYHPDRNKDISETTQKFREVTEAFQVLSDLEKKVKYDQFGLRSHSDDLERRTGLSKREREILDKQKLSILKQDYQQVQALAKICSISMGVSSCMGSYAVYEQFKEIVNYGTTLMFLSSLIIGVFSFEVRKEANKVQREKKRGIEMLTRDIEAKYGSA